MPEYTCSEIIAEYLIKEEIPYIFGVTGHGCTAFVDAFFDRYEKIKPIMVRHEEAAAHASDAFFRVSGKPAGE